MRLDRGYWLTIAASTSFGACQACSYMLGLVTEPLKADLHLSDARIGFLAGMARGLAFAVFLVPAARFADAHDRRRFMLVVGALSVAGSLTCAAANGFAELLVGRLLVHAAEACSLSLTVSLIGDFLALEKRPMGFSLYTSVSLVMLAVMFALIGRLESLLGWRGVFVSMAALTAVIVIAVAAVTKDPRHGVTREIRPSLRSVVTALLRKPAFGLLVGLACIYVFGITAAVTWIPAVLIRTHGISQTDAATFMAFSVGPLAGAAVAGSGAWLAWARRRSAAGPLVCAMWTSLGLTILYSIGLGPGGSVAVALLSLALGASPIVNSVVMSSVQEIAEPAYRATATALLIVPDALIGGGAGALVSGILSDLGAPYFGHDAIRYALLLTILTSWMLAAVLYWIAAKRIVLDLALAPPATELTIYPSAVERDG